MKHVPATELEQEPQRVGLLIAATVVHSKVVDVVGLAVDAERRARFRQRELSVAHASDPPSVVHPVNT